MKRIQKWSSVCLPVALIVGVAVGWMIAQAQAPQGKLPPKLSASSAPPSEVQEMEASEKAAGPPEKKTPNTRESALQKLRSFRSGNARPASPTPPPEVQEVEKGGPPPDQTPRQKPTKEGLLEKIRQMPGGPEMIEEAKKRGARIGMGPVESGQSFSWMDLFRVKEAEAQGTYSLTLSPSNNWYSSSPYGNVSFLGVSLHSGPPKTYVLLHPINCVWGTQIIQASACFTFTAPSDGWYIINIDASGAQATLKHYEVGPTYPTVATWDNKGKTGTLSYPALIELKAGTHFFYWVTSTFGTYVYEANAFNL